MLLLLSPWILAPESLIPDREMSPKETGRWRILRFSRPLPGPPPTLGIVIW
jgi:hypothetical protein